MFCLTVLLSYFVQKTTASCSEASTADVPPIAIATVSLPTTLRLMILRCALSTMSLFRGLVCCRSGGAAFCMKALESYFVQKNQDAKK